MDKYHSLSLGVSWLSIGINLFIAIAQLVIGTYSKSISIVTDAADSLRDIVATAVVIFSLNLSKKPADEEHPFGHGRVEDVGGIIISLLLLIIGFNFLKDSFVRLFHPQELHINFLVIAVMAAAAAIKLFLGFITQVVSKKASSEILEADAFHHYTDCLTTFIVAFGLIFVKKGYTYVDSVLGLIIAGLIIWWSFKMLREFADNLIGRAVSPEVYSQIQAIACSFNFVEGVHEIEVHSYGKNRVISLHIELNPKLSLEEAHSVADSIEKRVSSAGLGRCVVHVDLKPKCKVFEKAAVEKAIEDFLIKNDYVGTFHGIEIITAESSTVISFHLCLSKKTSLEESHLISHRLSEILKKKFSFSKINIHFEPKKT